MSQLKSDRQPRDIGLDELGTNISKHVVIFVSLGMSRNAIYRDTPVRVGVKTFERGKNMGLACNTHYKTYRIKNLYPAKKKQNHGYTPTRHYKRKSVEVDFLKCGGSLWSLNQNFTRKGTFLTTIDSIGKLDGLIFHMGFRVYAVDSFTGLMDRLYCGNCIQLQSRNQKPLSGGIVLHAIPPSLCYRPPRPYASAP